MIRRGAIYFVTDGEAIKIGFAGNVRKRIANLQISHHFPLFLLGSIPATRHEESVIHRRFVQHRLRGEWFKIHRDILDFIDEFESCRTINRGR